ncbi:ribonuclease H-like domain-containing protein [Tanacetum coccineum]|uniref:Ribonuclease H-like domain-containing protein n=1 Tax=Tanacetum coccineum TaxID=301880 RepID=A0ABQ5DY87_9ASTR
MDLSTKNLYDKIEFRDADSGPWTQGWRVGYKGDEWDGETLKVFVVPHSHNDPGWKLTIDDIIEHLVKVTKRHAFWSIKKSSRKSTDSDNQYTVLPQYAVSSKKIRRIRALTSQDIHDEEESYTPRMEFYMENMVNGRMILDSVQNGPLVCPTITEEDGTTRKKTYAELSASEKLQADCDCKATNIVLQGLPLDVYAIVNHHKVAKEIWDIVKLLMQGTKLSLQEKEFLAVLVFNQGDDLIAYLNKAMAFLIAIASSRVIVQQVQGRQGQSYAGNRYKGNATSSGGNNVRGQARNKDLDAYDFDRDDVLNAKTVLMTNLSNYGSDVISEVPHSDSYHNDMDNQSVHAMHDFEQILVVDFSNNKIHSDSNIILYS